MERVYTSATSIRCSLQQLPKPQACAQGAPRLSSSQLLVPRAQGHLRFLSAWPSATYMFRSKRLRRNLCTAIFHYQGTLLLINSSIPGVILTLNHAKSTSTSQHPFPPSLGTGPVPTSSCAVLDIPTDTAFGAAGAHAESRSSAPGTLRSAEQRQIRSLPICNQIKTER